MGYKVDFTIEREMIDDNWFTAAYSEEIKITGSGITDTVCFTQDGQSVGFTLGQFNEMMSKLRKTSLWCEVEGHFKYEDSKGE